MIALAATALFAALLALAGIVLALYWIVNQVHDLYCKMKAYDEKLEADEKEIKKERIKILS